MHEALTNIQGKLRIVIQQLQSTIPNDEPFAIAHNNWSFPGLCRSELVEEVQSIIDSIEENETEDLDGLESRITDYVRRLDHLQSQTVPNIWGNSSKALPAFQHTIDGLRKALSPALNQDTPTEARNNLRKLKQQLRAMEAELTNLEPRTASLVRMVNRIEQVYNAADQLPTDLETLTEARKKISELVRDATQDQGRVVDVRNGADELDKQLNKSAEAAKAVLDRCETAYSAATSVGLAAAFSERSTALSKSMWFWIGGLLVALVAGSVLGSIQLHALSEIFNIPDASGAVIVLNVILSVFSVGAPVWFAWLATKQIGQRFRLAEDYAFKASISRAYEGFRREAARFDKDMEAKLLASALTRLDELPLRLVEERSHGSPWHELATSDVMKRAMREVPEFAGQVKDLASKAVGAVKPSKAKPTPTPRSELGADE